MLAFINPVFAPGIILGCFISNMFSPFNPVLDCIIGTTHSAVAMLFITRFSKNLFIASLWPTIFCVFIGGMLVYVLGMPFTAMNLAIITGQVMLGEFAAMTVIGFPLFSYFTKNDKLMGYLKSL